MSDRNTERQLVGTAPYFVVRSLSVSLDYYCNKLGFTRPELWGEPPTFAMPHRDGFIFMLNQAAEGVAITTNRSQDGYWDAYVWVNDADALFAELQANGAVIDYEPTIQHDYGNKEFAVVDPDGYVIAFGQNMEQESQ